MNHLQNKWQQHALNYLSVQPMLTMEMNNILVMLKKFILTTNGGIIVCKESENKCSVKFAYLIKLVHLHLVEMSNNVQCDGKRLLAILSRVEELKGSFP